MDIYYFSGTGNSLQIAHELREKLSEIHLIPIISELNKEEISINSTEMGIIFPIHAFTIPMVVEEFLLKADFKNADFLFAISNRICSSRVFHKINKILKKKGKKLTAEFAVETPQNYIPVFPAPTDEEIEFIEKKLQTDLENIMQTIQERREHKYKRDGPLLTIFSQTLFRLVTFLYQKSDFFHLAEKFYADSKCTSCGICEKICLVNKIELLDGKPTWKKDPGCTHCFACFSYCPTQAIQKGKKTSKRGRYRNKRISYTQIAAQKSD